MSFEKRISRLETMAQPGKPAGLSAELQLMLDRIKWIVANGCPNWPYEFPPDLERRPT
jgi:hypothetical protein